MEIYTGIEYFADVLAIPEENFRIAHSFYSGDGVSEVYPDEWAFKAATGSGVGIDENNWENFFTSGRINFSGGPEIVVFKNGDVSNRDFSLDGSSLFLSFEKSGLDDTILISSIEGSDPFFSGFCLGVNSANKLYFKYWNSVDRSPYTLMYKNILSDKNLIFLSRDQSTISMGRFNSNTFEFDIQQYNLFRNELIESDDLYLGGYYSNESGILDSDPPPWAFSGSSNFRGYIDKFYFIYDFPNFYVNDIGKSLFLNPLDPEGVTEIVCYTTGNLVNSGFFTTGVTGIFASGFVVESTGITGYRNLLSGWNEFSFTGFVDSVIGSYFDQCGDGHDIIEQVSGFGFVTGYNVIQLPLTGFIYTSGSIDVQLTGSIFNQTGVWVTGEICDDVFTPTGEVLFKVDQEYLNSLSFTEVAVISKNSILSSGQINVFKEPSQYKKLNYNQQTNYIVDNIFRI